MIMQRLRSVTKYFLWVIAVVFVLFIFFSSISRSDAGKQRENLIAEVDGEPVTYSEFSSLLNKNLQMVGGPLGIDPLKERRITDRVINQLIMKKLVEHELEKRNIKISEEQIIDIIKNSPPPEIARDSSFWRGEQFDYNRYLELLRNPRASKFVENYAQQIKRNVPERILNGEVRSMVRVTSHEIVEEYLKDSLEMQLEYIKVPVKRWIERVNEDELQSFYEQNREIFKRDGLIKLEYISLPVEVEENTVESARELAGSIIKRAETVPFDTLVGIYSYIPENRDLYNGWVNIEDLPSVFTEELAGTETGRITEPVRSESGFHIFKLLDRERGRLNIKEIFLAVFPSMDTYSRVKSDILAAMKEWKADSTGEVMNEYNFKEVSYKSGFIPQLGVDFGTFLDKPEEGKVSYPMVGSDSMYIFKVKDVQKGIPDFKDIKEEVRDSLVMRRAYKSAENYITDKLKGRELPKYIKYGSYNRTSLFKLKDYAGAGAGLPEKVLLIASNLRENELSPPLKAEGNVYVTRLLKVEKPEGEELKEIIPQVAGNYQMIKQTLYYNNWLYELRKNADIKDYRYKLYD